MTLVPPAVLLTSSVNSLVYVSELTTVRAVPPTMLIPFAGPVVLYVNRFIALATGFVCAAVLVKKP
jgi:hypothetical protein